MPATGLTPHVVTSRAKQVSHARLASVQRFWVAATAVRRRITTASANRQAARLAGPLAVMFNSRGEDPASEGEKSWQRICQQTPPYNNSLMKFLRKREASCLQTC